VFREAGALTIDRAGAFSPARRKCRRPNNAMEPGAGPSRRDADVVMDQGAHVTATRVQRLTFR